MTSLQKVIRIKPKLFLISKNIEHNRQKMGEIFSKKYISSCSKITSWNQLTVYQKHISIFLKFPQNFTENSEFVKNLHKIIIVGLFDLRKLLNLVIKLLFVLHGFSTMTSSIKILLFDLPGFKIVSNVTMLVLLYGAPIWADVINARQYRRMEMVLVQEKAALRCVSAYRTVSTEAVCVLAGITPIEIVADERRRVYSVTCWVKLKSAKALRVRREERQVTLRKWKERLSESFKGEWTHLLIRYLGAWLERGHGQINFYLTQVMSGHGVFNAYLFHMKLAESPNCSNCDRRGRDDDIWHTLFKCLAFQLY